LNLPGLVPSSVMYWALSLCLASTTVGAGERIHNESATEGGWVRVKLTGYCGCQICCGKYAIHNRTSTGVRPVRFFTVAADPGVFPPGTILHVPGVGRVMVQDKGSAVRGLHLDVYHGREPHHHEEARRFGVRHTNVQIVHIPQESDAKSVRRLR
jgi:3D (Asp-Asp-Asp) domain-containing protein